VPDPIKVISPIKSVDFTATPKVPVNGTCDQATRFIVYQLGLGNPILLILDTGTKPATWKAKDDLTTANCPTKGNYLLTITAFGAGRKGKVKRYVFNRKN
jgi:hypothetical protein